LASITLITGVMAAGKSTVAQVLAERLPRAVHLRGDLFRRMIVTGREEMTERPTPGALRQLELRYRLAVDAARSYRDAGFNVVYQDVMLGEYLRNVVEMLGDPPPHVVVLCPSPEVVAVREAGRGKVGYGAWPVADLDRVLREEAPHLGLWLDSSDLTVDETVERILARVVMN
jgi:predicted kinase